MECKVAESYKEAGMKIHWNISRMECKESSLAAAARFITPLEYIQNGM